MPLTPLHLGSGLFLGGLTLRISNFWAIIFGSVAMDVEPLFLLIINPCYTCPHHGFLHSILGAVFGSLVIATILWFFRKDLDKISSEFKIKQSFSFPVLFFSAFFAWLIHIFIDSLTHYDVFLFWPLEYNPILIGPKIYWNLNFILLIFLIIGLFIIFRKIKNKKEKIC